MHITLLTLFVTFTYNNINGVQFDNCVITAEFDPHQTRDIRALEARIAAQHNMNWVRILDWKVLSKQEGIR